jgi:hypothetical protein
MAADLTIRDLSYRPTATPLDDLIDNPLQAAAQNIDVILGFGESEKKPDKIAVVDDGHGMDPEMIRAAVIWGGTHRENDRSGFGRYGYGLPSAAVSQGRRFTVFSIVAGGQLHSVTLDVDEVGKGTYTDKGGHVVVPEGKPAKLPGWVSEYLAKRTGNGRLDHGTVVVIENLDRLTWKTRDNLERHLKEHFGTTYRNFLRQVNLYVDGEAIEPVDPLFLTPGARYYDLDEDRAQALPPMDIRVKDTDGKKVAGVIRVRFAFMPPSFQVDKKKAGTNARFQIMKDHNGFVVLRNSRQIDVVSRNPFITFVNYDRNWKVELDFPATLDEEFSITTSKQQIVPSDRIWEILREAGVLKAVEHLSKEGGEARAKYKAAKEEQKKRASELVMQELQKHKTRRAAEAGPEQARQSQEALKRMVEEKSRATGVPPEQVEQQHLSEEKERPYKVLEESLPGAPFFRLIQVGGQKVLYLNTAHRFYTEVYAGPDSTPRLRAALELLLWVIGDCELDSTQERRRFYETERAEWSRMLSLALDLLNGVDSAEDELSARDAAAEDATGAASAPLQ